MQTVAHPATPVRKYQASAFPALEATLDRGRPVQCKAIKRWHQRNSMGRLDDACAAHPHFPLIACSDSPATFAPARGTPRPAA